MSIDDIPARRPLKSRGLAVFQRLAAALTSAGVSPNAISFSSIVFGCLAGAALAATATADGWLLRGCWLAGAVFIQTRLVANMLDGMVAVEGGRSGPTGDLWNEAPDRLSDAATLIGAGFAAGSNPLLGFGAALMAVFVAYARALGASVGAGQIFLGPQAKPQRMAVITAACVLSAIVPALNAMLCVVVTALWIVILGGAITAIRRFIVIARFLRNKTP